MKNSKSVLQCLVLNSTNPKRQCVLFLYFFLDIIVFHLSFSCCAAVNLFIICPPFSLRELVYHSWSLPLVDFTSSVSSLSSANKPESPGFTACCQSQTPLRARCWWSLKLQMSLSTTADCCRYQGLLLTTGEPDWCTINYCRPQIQWTRSSATLWRVDNKITRVSRVVQCCENFQRWG